MPELTCDVDWGFRVYGLGFRVSGFGFFGLRVWGTAFRFRVFVQGFELGVICRFPEGL